jgi:hypothetical protein
MDNNNIFRAVPKITRITSSRDTMSPSKLANNNNNTLTSNALNQEQVIIIIIFS